MTWRYAIVGMFITMLVPLALSAAIGGGYRFDLPSWAPEPPVPADNPMSASKVELGRRLFYDTRLSATGSMSCGSCHQQARAFTDGQPVHAGANGDAGVRNAMPLANVAYLPTLTWAHPNLKRLEDQVLIPIFGDHPTEMGMQGKEKQLFAVLGADPASRSLFLSAFPAEKGEINLSTVTKALAAFLRTLLSFDSAYDRFRYGGDANALSPAARRGEALFFGETMECSHCHAGINFTDNFQRRGQSFSQTGFHNTGLYNLDGSGAFPAGNPGLREFTAKAADEGKFRTPSLRNVALTAPYMHDGSIATLEDVIRKHYAIGGRAASSEHGRSPLRDPLIEGFPASDQEVADLVAFLNSLTDTRFLGDPRFSDPFKKGASKSRMQ